MKFFAKVLFGLLLIPALSISVKSIDLDDYTWRKGKIVLMNGTSLTGKLAYDLKMDIIKIDIDGKVKAFPPLKVRNFSYYDPHYRVKRQFFALPYQNNLKYNVYRFFEVIYEGNVALLSRTEKINKDAVSFASDIFPRPTKEPEMVKIDHFYLIFPDGKVHQLTGEDKQIYKLLGHKSKLRKYIKKHDLSLNRRIDLVKLMYFHEEIVS